MFGKLFGKPKQENDPGARDSDRPSAKLQTKSARKRQPTDHLGATRPFRRIGSLIPKGFVSTYDTKLKHAGIKEDARVWLGSRLLVSFFVGALFFFLYLAVYVPLPTQDVALLGLCLWLAGILLTCVLFYFQLYFAVADRTSALEKVLPDFLLLTVSNLRAGMTPFGAFIHAAKPEFGALHEEIRGCAARLGSSGSFSDALAEASTYFDSKIFQRMILLFTKGMQSGGQLASLLKAGADEVQHIKDLREELASSTRTYTLFLGFITVIIMPFLLSISTLFVQVFVSMQPNYEDSGAAIGGIPMFSGKISITPDEMKLISIMTLVLTSLLVSGLSGIIQKGKALYGIRYFPIFAIASSVMFFISFTVVGSMLVNFGGS